MTPASRILAAACTLAGLALAGSGLSGCSTQTDVSASTSVQQKYTHVWLTIQEVWFNTSATATAEDTTWAKFPLATPVTLDLASLTAGTLGQIATALKVPAGTYAQLRLIPVDASAALSSSAQTAGAQFNSEADYVDTAGTTHQAQLELLNPDKGIGVASTFSIKADTSQILGTSTTTTDTTTTGTTGTTGTTDTTTPVAAATSTSSTPVSLAISLDGVHDLVQFNYGTETGVLLSPHTAAYDVAQAGTIRGQIDLTNVGTSVNSSGQANIAVTAESVSSDGSHHTAVKTVAVATDGTFILYPLATSSTASTSYDLVIHGPLIATVIIKAIPVAVGDPSSTSVASVATVAPRSANAFTFNLTAGAQTVPPGALIDLYQTLPQAGEIPYLIDQVPMDPFSRTLFADQSVSQGTLDFGTYASGSDVSLQTATPVEGAGGYLLSAQAALFADGALSSTIAPPQSGSGPELVVVPTLLPADGAGSGTVSVTVAPSTGGKYNHGQLIVSHDGAVVQTVTIDSALTQNGGATLLVAGLPAGGGGGSFDNAVYYLSVRAWNSSNPAGTLTRQSYTTPVDLSTGSAAAQTLTVQ